MLNIILFGPPGAGKGTQSKNIMERYNLVHISTGELLRKHLVEETGWSRIAKKHIDDGNLAPDELVIGMVKMKMASHSYAKGFIFDGFPRTVAQAVALDEMHDNRSILTTIMLALVIDDDELRARIRLRGKTSGRADDQNDVKINNRISVYKEETIPVASYYGNQSKYHEINGIGSVDEIFNDICNTIDLINK